MPVKDIAKLKGEVSARVAELGGILTAVESRSDKKYTADEKVKAASLREEIELRNDELLVALSEERAAKQAALETGDDPEAKKQFRSIGEVIEVAHCAGKGIPHEKRDMLMGSGSSGGWRVPTEFAGKLRMFTPSEAVVRPRATVVPSSTQSPDAEAEMVGMDQSGSKGVYGGVTVKWKGEVTTREESTDPSLRMVKFTPKELSAYIDISNKLLRNAAEISGMIEQQIKAAIRAEEDLRFLRGDGVGKPLGIVGHASCKEITRAGSSAIAYADIVNILAATKFGGSHVWAVNQTTLPQLMNIKDSASNLLWQNNARDGLPGTIFGIPVIYTDRLPVLGTKGDICLLDLSYYGIKDGAAMSMMLEPYTQAVNQITRLYIFHNVDGQPLVKSPLLLEDGSTTVSPFVVLKA